MMRLSHKEKTQLSFMQKKKSFQNDLNDYKKEKFGD